MKILYGVQATGNGHITRARIMARALAREGIQVDWVFSGRKPGDFFDMEIFGDYRLFRGLTFVTRHGKVNYPRTLLQSNLWQLTRDIRQLDASCYPLVISDFEPVTAWAARRAGKPVLGISHQSAFLHPVPKVDDNLITRLFMRYFAPVTQPAGVHWHHFGQPILPPLVESGGRPLPVRADHILVYLPFASLSDFVPVLEQVPEVQFHVFHQESLATTAPNIHLHPFSREAFQDRLQQVGGVICSAGFELPSEAIQLGKKLLVQPVVGQMEQQSNALALQQLGYASVTRRLDSQQIRTWLARPQPAPRPFPDVAAALAAWIGKGQPQPFDSLAKALWEETERSLISQAG